MTPAILDWLRKARYRIEHPGRVLEVGSLNVNGSPRGIFRDAEEYIGIDTTQGDGVDRVLGGELIVNEFGAESFDTVVCCEVLEHAANPIVVSKNMRDCLRVGGHLIVTSPANGFREHRYPRDYWRLMPDAYAEIVFAGMVILEIREAGPRNRAGSICCLGRKQ